MEPAPATQPPVDRQAALARVKVPAIGVMLAGILGILTSLPSAVGINVFLEGTMAGLEWMIEQTDDPQAREELQKSLEDQQDPTVQKMQKIQTVAGGIFGLALGIATFLGGLKLKALKNKSFAMTGAILALVPCGCSCGAGLIFGIWALVAMSKPEVKDAWV